jgi:hypothetical protein
MGKKQNKLQSWEAFSVLQRDFDRLFKTLDRCDLSSLNLFHNLELGADVGKLRAMLKMLDNGKSAIDSDRKG